MSIEVRGGAGGVAARFADLRTEARVLDDAGDDVRARADDVAAVALDESVLAAAILCPLEAAQVGASVAEASLRIVVVSTALEGTSLVLVASAEAYELLDESRARALDGLHASAGLLLGLALPGLVVGGVLVGGTLVSANPALAAYLAAAGYANREALAEGAMASLFDNPWLMEGIAATAPWTVQGSLVTLTVGLVVPFLLSGGRWPTGDYTDAVGGLVAAGGLLGAFEDDGVFGVSEPVALDTDPPDSVAALFEHARVLQADEGQVQISSVVGADGVQRFVVQIPGTQDWSPLRGDNPVDLTTNVSLMAGEQTVMQELVAAAMTEAGVGPGDPVMLVGHSQGGITAAALAADPGFRQSFDVQHVVTGGSPIARFDIPSDISVLSIEHDQDPVPMLEGRENPDRPGWVTVERDLSGTGDRDPATAHLLDRYVQTGRLVDESTDPSLAEWRAGAEPFLGGSAAQVERVQIERVGP